MSKREQVRKIRKQLVLIHGTPISRAIGEVMDWCEANAFEPKTEMTMEEMEATEADTIELLALLEGPPGAKYK
ncbi:hypothetical protein [Pseudomonas sp. PS02303]|uniref:hypothetical protein n=1 Tax=Pseudomonas sp. PS02303 TaxID=2991429 RepID=UPI00249C381E|nr:hypothetical protein [Pseudomonas sp. PS02303]